MRKLLVLLLVSAGGLSAQVAEIVSDSLSHRLWEVDAFRCDLASALEKIPACNASMMAKNISGVPLPGPSFHVSPSLAGYANPYSAVLSADPQRMIAPGETVACKGQMKLSILNSAYLGELKALHARRASSPDTPWEVEADQKRREEQAAADRATDARVRANAIACAAVYRATIDKTQGQLTIRESQAVAYCMSIGWYQP